MSSFVVVLLIFVADVWKSVALAEKIQNLRLFEFNLKL